MLDIMLYISVNLNMQKIFYFHQFFNTIMPLWISWQKYIFSRITIILIYDSLKLSIYTMLISCMFLILNKILLIFLFPVCFYKNFLFPYCLFLSSIDEIEYPLTWQSSYSQCSILCSNKPCLFHETAITK